MNNHPYVYKLIHKETGEFYIGYRMANLVSAEIDLPKYRSSSKVVSVMGFDNFDYYIISEFLDSDREIASKDAYDLEQKLIHQSFTNPLCLNRFHSYEQNSFKRVGPHSELTKKKMSDWQIGKIVSNETKERIRNTLTGTVNGPCSEETKILMRKPRSEQTKQRQRKPKSEEHKNSISLSLIGKSKTEEQKIKIAKKLSKGFIIKSPDGIVYEGANLTRFCIDMGLSQGLMSAVCRGSKKQHKGWTGKYL